MLCLNILIASPAKSTRLQFQWDRRLDKTSFIAFSSFAYGCSITVDSFAFFFFASELKYHQSTDSFLSPWSIQPASTSETIQPRSIASCFWSTYPLLPSFTEREKWMPEEMPGTHTKFLRWGFPEVRFRKSTWNLSAHSSPWIPRHVPCGQSGL